MTFNIKGGNFYLDGEKVFLNSGEIHYFRIKRELWDKHLQAAEEAGLTTVSTYVPWAWHEPVKGVFDLDGDSCPERDLTGWMERCQAHGLTCILKPGPFILAETRGAGLPDWFLEEYGEEVRMRNSRGVIVQSDGVNLFNNRYLEHVALWYDRIMPFISEQEISAGGPVIMMQICNEIGVFSWLAHQADYSGEVKGRFHYYLEEKYSNIQIINDQWNTQYSDFQNIELPPDGRKPIVSKGDRSRDYEWHCFWRKYYGDYLRMLTRMARERGVTVPVYHNLPGWIYGSGYEFPVNITMYEDLFGDKSEIIFGVDHIPEFMSYRNMHDDRIINDIVGAMQVGAPMFAAEFQCGSREYHVVTNPREMELFYKASIANGLTGWNYYMFSQGRNPSRKGYSGDTFYWFTPLTAEGERTSAFPLVSRMSKLLRTCGSLILDSRRQAEICVLFYPPYYATELERPENGASKLHFNASSIRRPAYFDGLLKALQVLNIDYDMIDLSTATADQLGMYKQVWAFSTDEMNGRDQQVCADYARSGGNLVIFPCLPDREMTQKSCTILRDALEIGSSKSEMIDSPLIDIYDLIDIKCANPQITYPLDSLAGARVIAQTIRGNACGFEKTYGKGMVIHLGTWIGYDTESHKAVYEAIVNRSGTIQRKASSSNPDIIVRERFTDNNPALLFVGNYFNEVQTGKINYTHPASGEKVCIPYSSKEVTWPALFGIITPICLEVSSGLTILHCTSDLLDIKESQGILRISLYGDRDLPGELVFEGPGMDRIQSVKLDGSEIETIQDRNRIVMNYSHQNKTMMFLEISILE